MSLSNICPKRFCEEMQQVPFPEPYIIHKCDTCQFKNMHRMVQSCKTCNSSEMLKERGVEVPSDTGAKPHKNFPLKINQERATLNTFPALIQPLNTFCISTITQSSLPRSREYNCIKCYCNVIQNKSDIYPRKSHLYHKNYSRVFRKSSKLPVEVDNIARWSALKDAAQCGNNLWRIIIFCIVILSATSCSAQQCAVGLNTPGRTWPQGDIVLEYGQDLQIFCLLNETIVQKTFPGRNASDLVFFRNKDELESDYISIINETTISMFVKDPPPAEDMYYCKLKLYNAKQHEAVCLNKVVIGFKPQEPENFTCISHNWENMICSWDPVQNFITTRFSLVFKLPGRAGGRKLYPCPKENQHQNSCLWDTSTNPIYRQPYEYYTFILNAENVLGNMSVQYKFHHFAHVIPAKPANLSVVNKTSESALLHWSVPFPMQNFPPGLHHRVTFQNQWDSQKTWKVINITNEIHMSKRLFNLSGLEYANAVYDVRVFIKSAVAIGEDKWSQFSDITFRTLPALPGLSPRTDVGSFEITESNHTRDVYLYWQSIPQYLENGDKFRYHVISVVEGGREVTIHPSETTRTYAKFKNLTLDKNYRFDIVTVNEVGTNKQRAHISVPSQHHIPHEPIAFTKVAFDGGLYELSWTPPIDNEIITNYTIFWCDNERDRPYQCKGYLDWVHVPKSATIYNVTVPDAKKVYQFAISANTKESSTGMIWASCTVIHNKVVEKLKTVWINRIGSDFIEVGWKLGCSERIDIVEGFNIYYCPIISPFNLNCKEPKMKTTIKADPHTIHGVVHGLKPYTTYSLSVAVLMKSGEGLHSDPLYNTTLEAAPSVPPYNVVTKDVTDTSMIITWETPYQMNGVLRYYEVLYNGHAVKVEEANQVKLTGLVANYNYSIAVIACTVSCSRKSRTVYQTTKIGVPGRISIPNVRFINSSQVVVMWKKPDSPSGRLDYYEISVSDGIIQTSNRTEAQVPIPDCKTVGREKVYQFRVRAVNIAPDNVHLKGPWSEPGEGNCYSGGPSYSVLVILWVIGSISAVGFVVCLAYTSKRMWVKCKAMQDVEVKLPPGLAPNMKLLHKVGEQHIRQSSADSSGCSSGQESVTSSLTSDSQVSSDSGTEIDPNPVSPNKLIESTPAWEFSSLRQRNVGITKPGSSADTVRWDAYVKVAKSGDAVLGDTLSLTRSTPNLAGSTGCVDSQQTWSSTGYISMPSSEELSGNPSPVPTKDIMNPSGYSVIGAVPKPLVSKSDEHADIPSSNKNTLIPLKTDVNSANPYVTLAAFDQKPHDKKLVNTLSDFTELTFTHSDKSKKENFRPFSTIDKASKPYVQTGLINSFQKSSSLNEEDHKPTLAATSLTDSVNKQLVSPFVCTIAQSTAESKPYVTVSAITGQADAQCIPFTSSFATPSTLSQKLSDCASKPYVTVSSISDLTKSTAVVPSEASHRSNLITDGASRPYVLPVSMPMETMHNPAVTTVASSDATSKPYIPTTSAFQMLQQQAVAGKESENIKDNSTGYPKYQSWQPMVAKLEGEKPVIITKQNTGYVSIAENPKMEVPSTVSSSYVQHGHVEKPLTKTSQADGQYSKVTVAPSTMQ